MTIKDLSEELASYIADAEKLEQVMEAFREMDRGCKHDRMMHEFVTVRADEYFKLKALIDDE